MEGRKQEPPVRVEGNGKDRNEATFIFLHGYGDTAEGWISELFVHISFFGG